MTMFSMLALAMVTVASAGMMKSEKFTDKACGSSTQVSTSFYETDRCMDIGNNKGVIAKCKDGTATFELYNDAACMTKDKDHAPGSGCNEDDKEYEKISCACEGHVEYTFYEDDKCTKTDIYKSGVKGVLALDTCTVEQDDGKVKGEKYTIKDGKLTSMEYTTKDCSDAGKTSFQELESGCTPAGDKRWVKVKSSSPKASSCSSSSSGSSSASGGAAATNSTTSSNSTATKASTSLASAQSLSFLAFSAIATTLISA